MFYSEKTRAGGFTLIELLIVISIIAILATAVVQGMVGFDAEAKVVATKSSLDTLRSRVMLFRAKEGRYPKALRELTRETYIDAGVQRTYLRKIPPELVSSKRGSNQVQSRTTDEGFNEDGGWIYFTDTADVVINMETSLDRGWGNYEGQTPSEW